MRIEATRFKVKKEKIAKAEEMLRMLNERKTECLQTLHREKMYVETIFSEMIEGDLYLTWFSVQGNNGADVVTSEFQLDRDYLAYWSDCVDRAYKPVDMKLELGLILPEVYARIKELDNDKSA